MFFYDFNSTIEEGFSPLPEFGHPTQQNTMPLVVVTENEYIPLGTGFIVTSNGLLITAVHVIEEALKYSKEIIRDDGSIDHELRFFAVFVANTNKEIKDNKSLLSILLPIKNSWYRDGLDIGFCWLHSPTIKGKKLTYPVARLSPGIPTIGEHIIGFGYPNMKGKFGKKVGNNQEVIHHINTATTTGEITEVYPKIRDRAKLKFPSIRTSARFEHGMSGGPIFNESGYVCGVICSSFPKLEEDPDYISFGSLLWPAFGTHIHGGKKNTESYEEYMITDLVDKGYILCDDTYSNIKKITRQNGDKSVIYSYD